MTEKEKATARLWQQRNKDKIKIYNERRREQKKKWWNENKARLEPSRKLRRKEHYWNNREECLARSKEYQRQNPEKYREIKQRWEQRNFKRFREIQKQWQAERRKDPYYRLAKNMSSRISQAIARKGKKCERTAKILGCSLDSFRIYLESKFETGMTWENYGKVWHVDHIIPCAVFDLSKAAHQKRCFHFSNLQPLFAFDNRSKKDRIMNDHQFEILW
jgi:hypothetical protein